MNAVEAEGSQGSPPVVFSPFEAAADNAQQHTPEPRGDARLLKAAEALESVEVHIQHLMDAFRSVVELGSGERPRGFADVKRTLFEAHTLVKSALPTLPIVRALAVELRALATEEATRKPDISKPGDPGSIQTEQHKHDSVTIQKAEAEQNRADLVLSEIKVLLGKSNSDRKPTYLAEITKTGDTTESKSPIPFKPPLIIPEPNRLDKSDPVSDEVQALLGKNTTSIVSYIESVVSKHK